MRAATCLKFGLVAVLLATAGPGSHAQSDNYRDVTIWRPNFLTGRMEPSGGTQGQSRIIRVEPRRVDRPRAVAQPRRPSAPQPVIVGDAPSVPQVEPTSFVVVLGDSLAELVGQGLEDAFADQPTVKVSRKTRSDSGLVRIDYHDWAKTIRELLASDQKITLAVMQAGANDRQAIREGEIAHEPFSERWRDIYRQRIDEIAGLFAEKRIPLFWVGLPPMQNRRLSADMVSLNELVRERVERAGARYIDLWEGFVDTENRFAATGHDHIGQPARLRTVDGVHFTRAGARKAGHYVHVELKRLIETGVQPVPLIALPSTDTGSVVVVSAPPAMAVERVIDRMVGSSPAEPFLPAITIKPLAGPIVPLREIAPARNGELMTSATALRARGASASELDRMLADGLLPAPRAGRADDFSWPR